MTQIEAIFHEQRGLLMARLQRIVGDRETAADLCQDTFVRAWRKAPAGATPEQHRGWLHRTASNLALDELRRRRLRHPAVLDEERWGGSDPEPVERLHAREAMASLTPHERMVLLLRFEAGLSHRELGALLDITEEAARKRVERARGAFAEALRGRRADGPLVLFLRGKHDDEAFRAWIEAAGGRMRSIDHDSLDRELATADALLLGASFRDIHPALYGEELRFGAGDEDLAADQRDLRAVRAALAADVPIVGVCRGHQMLNIALGGSLWQDIASEGAGGADHVSGAHPIDTGENSLSRTLLGRRTEVVSEHHQGVRRLGRGVRVTSLSGDGIVEMVEVPSKRFVLGLQWHPEHTDVAEAGGRVAAALVSAARTSPTRLAA